MKKTYLIGNITLIAAAVLAGCNSNDHDQPANKTASAAAATTTVTITPSLGKITNARVILRNAKTGALLGSGNTGTSGVATIKAKISNAPTVIEVQGSDGALGATYFDEAANAEKPLPASQKIRALAPSITNNAKLGVTILTELAYQSAVKAAGAETGITSASIVNQANNQIKDLLAKELGSQSLLTPPTLIDKNTVLKTAINARNAANDYALKLAALANLGSGDSPVLNALQHLSDDIGDGNLDGNKGATPINYNHDSSSFMTAVNSYLSNYINQAQLNGIYTAQILANFNIVGGSIVIDTNTGTGVQTGNTCLLDVSGTVNTPQVGTVPFAYTYCYINMPANTCSNNNSELNSLINAAVNQQGTGVTFKVNSFTPSTNCNNAFVTYDFATGQVVLK